MNIRGFLPPRGMSFVERCVVCQEVCCLSKAFLAPRAFLSPRGILPVESFLVAKSFLASRGVSCCQEVCCLSKAFLSPRGMLSVERFAVCQEVHWASPANSSVEQYAVRRDVS